MYIYIYIYTCSTLRRVAEGGAKHCASHIYFRKHYICIYRFAYVFDIFYFLFCVFFFFLLIYNCMQVYIWKPNFFFKKIAKLACVTNNFNSTKLKCKSQHVLRHKRFWSADGNLILTEKSSHVLKSNTDNSLISRKHNVSMFSLIGECFTQYIYIYIYICIYIYIYI